MTPRTPLGGLHNADRVRASHLAERVHVPGPHGRTLSHGAGREPGQRYRRHR
jgi:hypothetical protein